MKLILIFKFFILFLFITLFFSCKLSKEVGSNYQVYGGNTPYSEWHKNPINEGYVLLGSSDKTEKFNGSYDYYVIYVEKGNSIYVDSVLASNGLYLTGVSCGNCVDPNNFWSNPDGRSTKVSDSGRNGGYIYFNVSGSNLSSITVYIFNPREEEFSSLDKIFLQEGSVISGTLGSGVLNPASPEINVIHSSDITGTVKLKVQNNHDSEATVPVGYTYSWGTNDTDYFTIDNLPDTGDNNYTVNLDFTVPWLSSINGTYIIFASAEEKDIRDLMSLTNWTYREISGWEWENNFNLASIFRSQYFWSGVFDKEALSSETINNGFRYVTYLTTNGFESIPIGLTFIKLNVHYDCYQETATESNECGGLDTGSYSSNGYWNDGEWDDNYTTVDSSGMYVTYKKPLHATSDSNLKAKIYTWQNSNDTYTATIPQACWDSGDSVQLWIHQIEGGRCGPDGQYCLYIDCYDGSSWDNKVISSGSVDSPLHFDKIYEEAMIWDY